MKRLQEIEFQSHCKKLSTFLKRLKTEHPDFFKVWGEEIEYNFSHNIDCEKELSVGYVLHTLNDEEFFYVCFIAYTPQQVI